MAPVVTVGGEIAPKELGFCQSHEHLWLEKGRSYDINPALCIDDAALVTEELNAYRVAGGAAVWDCQPVGCGRNAEKLVEVSQKSGVHIVASTGFHKMLFYPKGHWVFSWDEDALAALYTGELTQGMYALCDDAEPATRLPVRAGFIKTALDAGAPDVLYRKLFSAAAHAAVATGAVLMAHIEEGADPLWLADFLEERGVDLRRVVFCHMDRAVADLAVHEKVLSRGITLEYDTIAREKYHSNQREVEIIKTALAAGAQKQLLMGLDVTRGRLKSFGGAPGLTFILKEFIPLLRQSGVGQGVIDDVFIHNPARLLSGGAQ